MTESNGPPSNGYTHLSADEITLARSRIREWPLEERQSLTRMSENEARNIMLLTALLDLRPVPEDALPVTAVTIDLRPVRHTE